MDLWDFDEAAPSAPATPAPVEEPVAAEPEAAPAVEIKPRPRTIDVSPRRAALPEREGAVPKRSPVSRTSSQPIELKRKPADDLGSLDDDWDEPEAPAAIPESAPANRSATPAVEAPAPVTESSPADEPVISDEATPAAEPEILTKDESAEMPAVSAPAGESPNSLRSLVRFNKAETIGLGVFALILVAAAIILITLAKGRVPTRTGEEGQAAFPVKGKLVTLKEVTSYWREPVVGKDAARRDTKLIPVVKIESEGGPAALRIFFKDDKGETVGDSSTRSTGSGTIEVAATAGLDDIGMHAAYRTGETRPWKIEILEAPSTESSSQDFHHLLTIPVSTDRH